MAMLSYHSHDENYLIIIFNYKALPQRCFFFKTKHIRPCRIPFVILPRQI